MKVAGKRKEQVITFNAFGEKLKEGVLFNDGLAKLSGLKNGFIKKGLYRFNTPEEANKHYEDSLARAIAENKYSNGK